MAALIGDLNIIKFQLILTIKMAAPVGAIFIYYYILVKFDSPDGSTYWGFKYYKISVNFDHQYGSTSWSYIYILLYFS